MGLKIASYNISGGFFNEKDETEYLDKEAVENVDNRLFDQIVETVNSEKIDIICFQEIITTESFHYIKSLCEKTELKYYDYFEISECNIVKGTNCGIAILSRYPLETIKKEFLPNPGLTKTTKSGNTYYLYDKGYMVCNIEINNNNVKVLTHHGFPYRVFDSTPEEHPEVFKFFDDAIEKINPDFVTGDFNADDFMSLMEKTKEKYCRTIDKATTIDGEKFDDILVRKNNAYTSKTLKLLSDHYMAITCIE